MRIILGLVIILAVLGCISSDDENTTPTTLQTTSTLSPNRIPTTSITIESTTSTIIAVTKFDWSNVSWSQGDKISTYVVLKEPLGISLDENAFVEDRLRIYALRRNFWINSRDALIPELEANNIQIIKYVFTGDGRIMMISGSEQNLSKFINHPYLEFHKEVNTKHFTYASDIFSVEELRRCNYDDECVGVSTSPCGFTSVSINSKFSDYWGDRLDIKKIGTACVASISDQISLSSLPVCVNNTCELIPNTEQLCRSRGSNELLDECKSAIPSPYKGDFSVRNSCSYVNYICNGSNEIYHLNLDWGFYSNHNSSKFFNISLVLPDIDKICDDKEITLTCAEDIHRSGGRVIKTGVTCKQIYDYCLGKDTPSKYYCDTVGDCVDGVSCCTGDKCINREWHEDYRKRTCNGVIACAGVCGRCPICECIDHQCIRKGFLDPLTDNVCC